MGERQAGTEEPDSTTVWVARALNPRYPAEDHLHVN